MDIEKYIKKKVEPIFTKVLQEGRSNRVLVGRLGFKNNYVFVQPHNCRVYFDFVKNPNPMYGGSVVVKNSTELMFKDLVLGCRVTIKKTTIEVVNLIDHDKRYVVPMKDSYSELVRIGMLKVKECRPVVEHVLKLYGGSSRFMVKNLVIQDWKVESESFIDSIGAKVRFRNDVVKKEYGEERNAEFSNAIYTSSYLTNQAALMEDFDMVKWCEDNINCFADVFNLEKVVSLMSFDNRVFLSNYLFKRFGGGING